jgi:hypothetical protein
MDAGTDAGRAELASGIASTAAALVVIGILTMIGSLFVIEE